MTVIEPSGWDRGQNSTFSEQCHVAYQIKGSEGCSNIQAHILSLHALSTPGVGSKFKTFFFSECSHVAYKLDWIGS